MAVQVGRIWIESAVNCVDTDAGSCGKDKGKLRGLVRKHAFWDRGTQGWG
jgi:hypothetical protein